MLHLLSQAGHKIATLLKERTDYGVRVESPSLRLMNQYLGRYPLSSLLPYRSYDPATEIFHNENSVGFILETYPMVGSTEEMQREISGLFQHTLPEGSHLQFILWADPRIGHILENWKSLRDSQSDIFRTLATRRIDHLKGMGFQGEKSSLTLRDLRCIVAYSQASALDNPVEEQKLLQLRDQVKTALQTLGMPVKSWDANELLNTLDGILNPRAIDLRASFNHPTDPVPLKWNPFDSLDL